MSGELRLATGTGLEEAEATRRLARDGPNELPRPRPPSLAGRVGRQLADAQSLLLLLAGSATLAVLREIPEGVAILAILVLNVAVGVGQEARADRAVAALRALTAPMAKVRRAGATRRVPAAEVVVGDLVEVAAGDRMPADLRLLSSSRLGVDESALTGEALPAEKEAGLDTGPDVALGDRRGELFAGTLVVRGQGAGVAERTGARTEVGRIAGSLRAPGKAPLERELAHVSRRIGLIAISLGALVVVVGLSRVATGAISVGDVVLTGVALAIAAVPESLAAAVTTALALGARRMAGLGVIVRRLAAIEGLGATTVIASDKTGTLTTGRLAVVETAPADGRGEQLTLAALRCNDARGDVGDPVDVALRVAAERAGARLPGGERRLAERPFDPATRSMAVVSATADGPLLTVKGAPEVVLARCRPGPDTERLAATVRPLAARGLRVLAFAEASTDDVDAEGLRPLGLVGLRDELRRSARAAVDDCRAAGVRVVMVTGDHADTARAVATEAGIEADPVVTSAQLAERDSGEHAALLRRAGVVARVDPATKLSLIDAHRAGDVVTMTGDGINDAPALRNADVGVAVAGEEGTDVAREAASVVVTGGDLGTIVTGVRQGRRLYHNVASMIGYLLAGNLSEIIIVLAGLILWPDLAVPLLPVQLLWINLVTDGLPALALGVDTPPSDPLTEPPRRPGARLLSWPRLAALAGRAAVAAGLVLAAAQVARASGWDAEQVRTQVVLTLVLAHLMLAYVARARRWTFEAGWWRAAPLRRAVGVSLALQTLVVAVPVLGVPLALVPLPALGWAMAVGAGVATPFLCDLGRMARRAWRARRR